MDIASLSAQQIRELQIATTPKLNKYIAITPTVKQTAAMLMNNVYELLYGGAAGGGKSVFLLAAALQYVDVPNYSAILLRKTFSDLMLPAALIPMSQEWLAPFLADGSVVWKDKDKKYIFKESNATLSFGYLDAKDDHLRYQGAQFQFIGFDEATHIAPSQYLYLHSRLRKDKKMNVPLRIRATANPGGTYGDFYYNRFFVDIASANEGLECPKRVFLPSGLADNPHLDAEEYKRSLAELDPVTRAQLENGDWEIREKGDLIDTNWILTIDANMLPSSRRAVRFWDLASIDPKYRQKHAGSREPDWTSGVKMSFDGTNYYIEDVVHVQKNVGDCYDMVANIAHADSSSCAVRMEKEGGSSGEYTIQSYAKNLLGFDFAGVLPGTSKVERARPFAAAAQRGNVYIVRTCRCLPTLFAELSSFPSGAHDDLVDCCSGAFNYFSGAPRIYAPDKLPRKVSNANILDTDNPNAQHMFPSTSGSYWHTRMS